jgi:hypothetical protein
MARTVKDLQESLSTELQVEVVGVEMCFAPNRVPAHVGTYIKRAFLKPKVFRDLPTDQLGEPVKFPLVWQPVLFDPPDIEEIDPMILCQGWEFVPTHPYASTEP